MLGGEFDVIRTAYANAAEQARGFFERNPDRTEVRVIPGVDYGDMRAELAPVTYTRKDTGS